LFSSLDGDRSKVFCNDLKLLTGPVAAVRQCPAADLFGRSNIIERKSKICLGTSLALLTGMNWTIDAMYLCWGLSDVGRL
jgi:hypothetical protein